MYGVPRYIWPWQFYYNKKMFEDAGIAQPPQTWDEFVQDALKLKEKGMQYPYAEIMSEKSSYIPFVIQLRARGGEFWDYQKGVPIFNSPEGVAALKFLADLNLKYKVMSPQSFEYSDTLKSMESFRQGSTALFLSTPQTFGQANDPKLSKIVGQAAVSIIPGDKLKTASYAETGGIAIPSSSKNKEAAFEFIKFATSAEQEKAMALGAGRIPVNKEALADMEVQKKNPHFTPIAVQLQYPYGIFKHERATEISDVVSQHVTAAVAGRETPEQALKAAEADALRIAWK
jgi:multiple sugar transport system substrate-binding protein